MKLKIIPLMVLFFLFLAGIAYSTCTQPAARSCNSECSHLPSYPTYQKESCITACVANNNADWAAYYACDDSSQDSEGTVDIIDDDDDEETSWEREQRIQQREAERAEQAKIKEKIAEQKKLAQEQLEQEKEESAQAQIDALAKRQEAAVAKLKKQQEIEELEESLKQLSLFYTGKYIAGTLDDGEFGDYALRAQRIYKKIDEKLGLYTSAYTNPIDELKQISNWEKEITDEKMKERLINANIAYKDMLIDQYEVQYLMENQRKKSGERIMELNEKVKEYREEIKSEYGRVLLSHPDNVEANWALGSMYREEGKGEEARVMYRRAMLSAYHKDKVKYNEMKAQLGKEEFKEQVMADLGIETQPTSATSQFIGFLGEAFTDTVKDIAGDARKIIRDIEIWSKSISISDKTNRVDETMKEILFSARPRITEELAYGETQEQN